MIRNSTARWQGNGLHGKGELTRACPLSKALSATPITLGAKLV